MRRFPVLLNEEAIRDLDDIYRYVAEASGSSLTAIRFVRRIRRRCLRIGNVPFGGTPRAAMNNQSQWPGWPQFFHDSGLGKRFTNL
jgi:plasmid stabilization system protein ParE